MIAKSLALTGRARQWALDAAIGATAALVAITAAQAALPARVGPLAPPPARRPVAAPLATVVEPAPAAAVLIAFVEPVPGHAVVSPFGLRKLPWEAGGRLHEGVDIAAPAGVPVLAAADGVVTAAGVSDSYGRFVEVRHAEGLESFYAHLGAIGAGVAAGLAVKAGAPIGAIGSSGTSTGPHLHFEIRDPTGRPLDPKYFLERAFATAEDLPLGRAARVPRGVRIAQVSTIPESKRALMEARAMGKTPAGVKDAAPGDSPFGLELASISGRDSIGARNSRRALIAQIAASQKAEMARDSARPHATISGAGESAAAPVDGASAPS